SADAKPIYKMAEMAYSTKDFDKAIFYFKEATRQYRNYPGVLQAQDQLADCYRKLAEQAKDKMLAAKDEKTKAHHRNSRQSWLEQGALTYEVLADELEHKARQGSLTPSELGLLR